MAGAFTLLAATSTSISHGDTDMPSRAALTLYASDPAKLADFWSAVLDLVIDPADAAAIAAGSLAPTEAVLLGRRGDFHVWISPAVELPPANGRIHFEIELSTALDSDRLVQLGATREWDDPDGRWVVYTDPEGNRFCAIPPPRRHTSA